MKVKELLELKFDRISKFNNYIFQANHIKITRNQINTLTEKDVLELSQAMYYHCKTGKRKPVKIDNVDMIQTVIKVSSSAHLCACDQLLAIDVNVMEK